MYRWVDHTGELELEIEAPDERSVFADAVAALGELMQDDALRQPEPTAPEEARELELRAPDHATLLADCLAELVFHAETEDFVPARLGAFEIGDGSLRATVHGYRGRPPHLVKAVTYHQLAFDRTEGGWRARVVLDV